MIRERLGASNDLLGALGGFAAAMPLPAGYREPVLVTAADGVGTKTELARLLGRRDTIGQDLVAMCVDDVVCHGARPLWFLDYLAVGRIEPDKVAELVDGIARACESAGCELVGGETAEHPGLMGADAFDLAGFCIGIVEREDLIDGSQARSGDVIVGLGSSGLHANGYSLVRALMDDRAIRLDEPFDTGASVPGTLGDGLLSPTRIYARDVLAIRGIIAARGSRLGGIAHVTGGGLSANLPRSVGPDLGVEIDTEAWPEPPLIGLVRTRAGMSPGEARAVFNGGIGMALVVAPDAAPIALSEAGSREIPAWVIGRVIPADESGPTRYREAGPL